MSMQSNIPSLNRTQTLSWRALVLAVAMLVPTLTRAQADTAQSDAPSGAVRVLAEVGGGASGTLVATGAAYLVGDAAWNDATCGEICVAAPMNYGPVLAIGTYLLAAPWTISAGTYLAGELAGGNSNYWYTLLGTAGGGALGALLATAALGSSGDYIWENELAMTSIYVLPMLGSVLLYELANQAPPQARAERQGSAGLRAIPTASLTADGRGAVLGAVGAF